MLNQQYLKFGIACGIFFAIGWIGVRHFFEGELTGSTLIGGLISFIVIILTSLFMGYKNKKRD
ncbi:hypothetical protein GCM10010965_31350 [Caldalkalibacillus thermarum]|uniref:hypothetical protein n=1 Tax=Caldalkalibacillus thermarum TaxID=296745 RepID=UPI0016686605|nr:hypothetical protein [Caldalkalibacillus thermarum]GGK36129.1 hypothetical protein GCM10010965_31350 [Caldalkalibacillus thermarum]